MANPGGFLDYARENPPRRPVEEFMNDGYEEELLMPEKNLRQQAGRCMDCGIPFCQTPGCPLINRIPDWCSMISSGRWEKALDVLHSTNNFPEITGRICHAPCETSCTLSIDMEPVIIKHIELQIAEHGWSAGWILPEPADKRTGKRVAVIGSGPSGLTVAQQLARSGHDVTVFEKADHIGGFLRYGVPDFILEKHVVDRRLKQMKAEGVTFEAGVDAGIDLSVRYIKRSFDATVLTAGSNQPRALHVPSKDVSGVFFGVDFLREYNRRTAGGGIDTDDTMNAGGKNVVIIGAGFTAQYCIGACLRQGALAVHIVEPPQQSPTELHGAVSWFNRRDNDNNVSNDTERVFRHRVSGLKYSSGADNRIRSVTVHKVVGTTKSPLSADNESGYEINADLVLIAEGFVKDKESILIKNLSIESDAQGNIVVNDDGQTSSEGIFAAGDCVFGATTMVDAMHQGRIVAESVYAYLK